MVGKGSATQVQQRLLRYGFSSMWVRYDGGTSAQHASRGKWGATNAGWSVEALCRVPRDRVCQLPIHGCHRGAFASAEKGPQGVAGANI